MQNALECTKLAFLDYQKNIIILLISEACYHPTPKLFFFKNGPHHYFSLKKYYTDLIFLTQNVLKHPNLAFVDYQENITILLISEAHYHP
jgi:hypothetical protein